MNGSVLDQPKLQNIGEANNPIGSVSNLVAGSFTAGNHKTCTLAGNTSFTLPSGLSTAVKVGSTLRITQPSGGSYTIT